MTSKFRRSSSLTLFEDRRLLETRLWISFKFFSGKNFFFPKLELLNLGCGLPVSVAYVQVFTVMNFLKLSHCVQKWRQVLLNGMNCPSKSKH